MDKTLHTDKELLELIYIGIQDTKSRLMAIEKSVNTLEDKQREICTTLYGDDSLKIKGLIFHIETLRDFMYRYKKWEFAIGVIVGLFGFIWAAVIGVHELLKK